MSLTYEAHFSLIIAPTWNWNKPRDNSFKKRFFLIIAPTWNWNEQTDADNCRVVSLIIAPTWNWNSWLAISIHFFACTYNCTNVELKPNVIKSPMTSSTTYNCTNVELKRIPIKFMTEAFCIPYNCTNVELKRVPGSVCWCVLRCLIIAPTWNWNMSFGSISPCVDLLIIAPTWNWNLFHICCSLR